ncbi:hypothetical protein G7K_3900-t1 [Saitoella complicata NRRL Y-17804]|uniref:Peptidase A1 domain-containing protein n=2 Tax=Saitoella complicata (strain BCRC 22490 / CBS 7301 / JCM 7358 / NBRC 10748 / NRRL Y-17804) TaxID=698492 RepID=A0A0E9NIW9_SAICN|nr:hypothetical protein G7K_3900-t1 [Saitoella complicata NRRL Y-17804]
MLNSPGVYEYLINVTIGTPPQNITLIIDTGSSDLWVNTNASCSAFDDSADAALCNQLGVYDPTNSSTFVNYTATDESFILNVTYLTGYVLGSQGSETVGLGSPEVRISNMTFGLAEESPVGVGIMGIGFELNEAEEIMFPTIVDQLYNQGFIDSHLFGLYLDDVDAATGNIVFGGYDEDKIVNDSLIFLPIVPIQLPGNTTGFYLEYLVELDGINITTGTGNSTAFQNTTAFAVLDSGTTALELPNDALSYLVNVTSATFDETFGAYLVDCDAYPADTSEYISFTFHDQRNGTTKSLNVSFYELVVPLDQSTCALAVEPAETDNFLILGGPFLRSTYVIFDLDEEMIVMGQTLFNTTASNIAEVPANSTEGPFNVSSIAPTITFSYTGLPTTTNIGIGNDGTATST